MCNIVTCKGILNEVPMKIHYSKSQNVLAKIFIFPEVEDHLMSVNNLIDEDTSGITTNFLD